MGDLGRRRCGRAHSPRSKTMVALLDRRRYLSNLVRDVTEILGALEQKKWRKDA